MTDDLPVASADADPTVQADWLELEALRSTDGRSSFQTLAVQLRISGTAEVLTDSLADEDPNDKGGEQTESVACDAWMELERRNLFCGGDEGSYPFALTAGGIELKDGWEYSSYLFQLLLSHYGHAAGPNPLKGERIFERLSALAAMQYFGGEVNSVRHYCFGSPRDDGTGFRDALHYLCTQMNAGRVQSPSKKMNQQKDGHLDLVVWRPFHDRRPSQLIAFGQCATTAKLNDSKMAELHPSRFREHWLEEGFYPDPIRAFFVPRSIEGGESEWRSVCIDGGIVFDRCRITELAGELSDTLADQCSTWTRFVAEERLGRPKA